MVGDAAHKTGKIRTCAAREKVVASLYPLAGTCRPSGVTAKRGVQFLCRSNWWRRDMAATITREVLESHLKCRYKGHLKLAGERGSLSDYELLLAGVREQVRQTATERLLARHGEGEVLRGCTATAEVLRRGVPLLLDATVEGEGLSVRFDALQRAAGKSKLREFYYLPVLFHEGERATQGQRLLLQLCGLVLGAAQGKEPERGVLIHGHPLACLLPD